jgi:hypothetical protein
MCEGVGVAVGVTVLVELLVGEGAGAAETGFGPVQNLWKKALPLSTPVKFPKTTARFI